MTSERPWLHKIALCAAAYLAMTDPASSAGAGLTPHGFPESEAGTFLTRSYGPAEYGGSAQNWAVVQDARGVIYVGNTEDGVLEFDGDRWRRIPLSNKGPVLSLAADDQGRIFVGGVGEIGYLAPDASGRMQYVSLMSRLSPADRDFADVYKTYATADGVYFCTFRRLIRVSGDTVRTWDTDTAFHFAFLVRGTIFIREVDKGLMKLRGDELTAASGGEHFAGEKIYAMLPWPSPTDNDSILIGTRQRGWLIYDGATLKPWATEADAIVARGGLYDARWLADGRLAAVTLDSGVVLLDRQGRLRDRIDKHSGLASEIVYGMFQDQQGSLWLALDQGIAQVQVAAPLTRFGEAAGIEGSTLALYRHAGTLYAGTTQGLYRLDRRSLGRAQFVRVAPQLRGETLAFLAHADHLLVANRAGVFELRDDVAKLVWSGPQGASALLASRHDPDRVHIGKPNGLSIMRFANGRWTEEDRATDFTDDVRSMFAEGNYLWLATTTGVRRLTMDESRPPGRGLVSRIERFGVGDGLPNAYSYAVGAIDQRPRFATAQGLQWFDPATKRFMQDPFFAKLFASSPRWVLHFQQDARGRVWMRTSGESPGAKQIGAVVPHTNGASRWDTSALSTLANPVIDVIYADDDGVIWFGGEGAIYRYDSTRAPNVAATFRPLLREVATRGGRLVFGGAGAATPPKFNYSENALRFEFAAPGAGDQPARFQVYLEGADDKWMHWSSESHREYTNLREGVYRFHLRAMNSSGAAQEAVPYEFRVLPPWYRTWLAYVAYTVMLIAIMALASRWRSIALTRRNRELATLVAARTQELQAANAALTELSVTDSVTGLKNRRHLIDQIEHDVAAVRRAYADPARDRSKAVASRTDLLFVLVDIDHFKQVNDHYGHAAGDRVLQQFARLLLSVCRETDTAVRWGGEEFMVLARFAEPDSGPLLAERIRAVTAAHLFLLPEGKTLRRTCSIGFASFPLSPVAPDTFTWEDTVELADQCLYKAKHGGRNTWLGVCGTQRAPVRDSMFEQLPDVDALVAEGSLSMLRPAAQGERSSTAA